MDPEEVLLSEFNIILEKLIYYIHPDTKWFKFFNNTGASRDSHGVHLPRELSAHLKKSSKFLSVNLLHEYFGHGLFCEHTILGQKIVSLEQALAETEKEIFNIFEISIQQKFQDD